MAKMTKSALQAFVTAYVDAAKQAGTWTASTNNIYGLLDKIGKQITLDGYVEDKLPEFDGDELPYGKTIEEYFADFILPENYVDPVDGSTYSATYHRAQTEAPSYNYTLGRKKLATSVPYDNVERAALGATEAANMISNITDKLYKSETIYKYTQKKQLIANAIAKAEAATNAATLVQTIAVPTDTVTSEAFIKQVKQDVEDASFVNEGHNLANNLIGAAPELVLYVKKGVMPTIEVDALAGAFNRGDLAIPARVKVLDDFGDNNTGVYAVLMDPRMIKLHNGYKAVRTDESGEEDFITFILHSENTGFISKFTYFKAYKNA